MRISVFLMIFAFAFNGLPPAKAADVPKFSQYKAARTYSGAAVAPILDTPGKRMFKTRIRDGVRGKRSNFAGEWIIVAWGCGTTCATGAVVNARTGVVVEIPFSICCAQAFHDGFRAIEARRNSRLIIFAGLLNEDPPMAAHFFEFTGRGFRRVATIPNDGTFR